ncbi:MAG: ABC transporter permease [Deltaproteobacteria bacterium]|nr:ABC transporter permease [Deltaproteobacteria bacterium]
MMDLLRLSLSSMFSHRLRSVLSMLGIAIGIGSVILLTSIGEGTRQYILAEFSQFGTRLIAIHPGKAQTLGVPGVLGGSTHKLTLEDALALERIPGVVQQVPVALGTARVEAGGLGRSVMVYGATPAIPEVWRFQVRQGSFWPTGDPRRGAPVTVLGPRLKRELFDDTNALGRFVRIGGTRFRVVGIMEPKGQFLGFDIDDSAYIPVATAMKLFNLEELSEIDLLYANADEAELVKERVRQVLMERHGGTEDFTVLTQEAMLSVFGNIMNIITLSVAAIAAISLLVGAIGILTMMWIAVGERTPEIGLVRAIGASRRQVRLLFLAESAGLATLGGLVGLAGGLGICAVLRDAVPGLPVHTPTVFVVIAVAVSLITGLVSGVLPAQRAARLDPIDALRAE